MTISVTPDEAFEPPRNEITVSTPTDTVMTAVAVYRNDPAGRFLVRTQPMAGFDERTVYDYEAPFGQSTTYDWTATYIDPDDYTPSFTEDWSAYPTGWAGDTADGTPGTGELFLAVSGDDTLITRNVTFEWQEIEISQLLLSEGSQLQFLIDTTGEDDARHVELSGSGLEYVITTESGTDSIALDLDDPIKLTRVEGGVLLSGTGGSVVVPSLYGAITRINLYTVGVGGGITCGTISVVTAGASIDIAEESSPVVLNSDQAWLIHPSSVGLSFPLTRDNPNAAGILDVEPPTNSSKVTLHSILGARNPIAVTTGARAGDVTSMTVYTIDYDERTALRALLATDFPLLVQIPAAWDTAFDSGFYSVGETRESRPSPLGSSPWREYRLPLTRVQSPIVDVQDTSWTYTHVVLAFASYADVKTAYATYADLLTDTRL